MRVTIDTGLRQCHVQEESNDRTLDLYSAEAFSVLSRLWLKTGWGLKYSYAFSWMGRPIIQLPEDIVRIQEVLYRVRPDVLIETGVARGGSLVFYASLFKAMGTGRVIGVDVEIRPENRRAIEGHPLSSLITLVEGSSVDPQVIDRVGRLSEPGAKVFVVLDSNHSRKHVAAELEAYAPLVGSDSYIVATDGIMEELYDAPGGRSEWRDDNPRAAAADFAARHPEFVLEDPAPPFDESSGARRVSYWPGAYLRRVSPPAAQPR